LQAGDVGGRDVGEVGRDGVEAELGADDGGEQIRAEQGEVEVEPGGVVAGDGEGVVGAVAGGDEDVAAGVLDGEGDRARAGADVEDVDRARGEGQTGEQPVDEVLGLGAGDEDTSVDVEVEAERVEASLAGDVGDGLAGEAAANEVAEDGAGWLVDLTWSKRR
jgi:hypothetical protein